MQPSSKGTAQDKIDFSYVYRPCEAIGGTFWIYSRSMMSTLEYISPMYPAWSTGFNAYSFLTLFNKQKTLSPAEALNQLYKEFNRDYYDRSCTSQYFMPSLTLKIKISYIQMQPQRQSRIIQP